MQISGFHFPNRTDLFIFFHCRALMNSEFFPLLGNKRSVLKEIIICAHYKLGRVIILQYCIFILFSCAMAVKMFKILL